MVMMKPLSRSCGVLAAASLLLLPLGAIRADTPLSLASPRLADTKVTPTADGLKVEFGAREDWPHIAWQAPEGGWDWSKHEALVLTIANPEPEAVSFHVKIGDVGKDGRKRSTQVSGSAPAGKTERFFVSLEPRSLREKSGMRHLPPLRGDYGVHLGTGIEPGHVEELQIFRATPSKPATLIVKSVVLAGQASLTDLDGIIDRYGQYTRADWPGKVKSDADLRAAKEREDTELKAQPAPKDRSRWGGWASGPRLKATGFFRTEQRDGRWWMVDPDGYLFLSVGIDVVRPSGSTRIEGREAMFRDLPPPGDPMAAFFSGGGRRNYNFLRANLTRKYGADVDASFGERAIARLKSWGFNTLGNWSVETYAKERQFPYVVAVGSRGGFATVPGHKGGRMPDPFDPAFAADVEASLAPKTAQFKNDPACIGYFYDNELPWGMPRVESERYVLCYGALGLGEDSPAKRAFVEMLTARYATIDALNAAWKTGFASWDELKKPYRASAPVRSDIQRKDFSDYLGLYADKYFSIVSSAIKRQDPNHLYLGCRFAFWFTEEAVRASAKYVDTISFNIYNWNPGTYRFAQELGKPCFVGEFHFGATDRGMFTGNITVKDQNARGERYADYVKSVLSEPAFVGCHWFQYHDQPTTGRDLDGENFNIGFASITDTPYPELIAAARAANARIYEWHSAAGGTGPK